ncbi:Ig-like domain repeat protein [Methanocella sp. MCL-LM]|uniref:Ig-like domain repeat protein n=1 Tax=Methanocella sp. MCL-LM TaxID=3412035 RepID=UPI003C763D7B
MRKSGYYLSFLLLVLTIFSMGLSHAATPSVTELTSSPNPSFYQQAVTFTATAPANSTGSVAFMDGATTLGTATLSDGTATFTTSALTAGSHSITAVYGGDSNFEGSTSPVLTQTVGKKTPSVKMASSPRPSVYGQPVTMTVTLPADATGTVTFKDGSTVLGTITVSGGTASLTAPVLLSKYYYSSLVGYYSGDDNYIAYRSDPKYQHIVYAADTTTTLISSSNPSLHGSPVTITAVVEAVAPGGGVPGGSVELFQGPASLGTRALDGSGRATFTLTDLDVGSYSYTAVYGGVNTHYSSSTTSVPLIQVVSPDLPAADFTANVTSGTVPLAVQFTDLSTVSPASWQWNFGDGTPNSTVQNPVHVFGSPGVYAVTLTATNADGSGSVQKVGLISATAPTPTPVPGMPATYNMSDFYAVVTPAPPPQPTASSVSTPVVTPAPGPTPTERPPVSTTPTTVPTADGQAESGFPWWIPVAGVVSLGLVAAAYFLVFRK